MKLYWDWKQNWLIHLGYLILVAAEIAVIIYVFIPHNSFVATAVGIVSFVWFCFATLYYLKIITTLPKDK